MEAALVGLLGVVTGSIIQAWRDRASWKREREVREQDRADRERAQDLERAERTRERFHERRLDVYTRFIEAVRTLSKAQTATAGALARHQRWASDQSLAIEVRQGYIDDLATRSAASFAAGEQVSLTLLEVALVSSDAVYQAATALQKVISDSIDKRLQLYIDGSVPSPERWAAWKEAEAIGDAAQEAFRVAVREETQGG